MNPFTRNSADQVSYIGEPAVLERIQDWLGEISPPPPAGIGDDCAVLAAGQTGGTLLTTDAITWNQHFDQSVPPEAAGSKLLRRNLSDIAAMGGIPGPALLSLLCARDLSLSWLKQFFSGFRADCERFNVQVLGGDISELPEGSFSAVLTQTGSSSRPIPRTGARPGERVYVTGSLGGSLLGKHYLFEPRLEEGMWLAARGKVTAMMDLSDGLAKDLPALLPHNCHAAIDLPRIPVAEAAIEIAAESGRNALDHAFCDGEDYELLFTHPSGSESAVFEAEWSGRFPHVPLTCIGTIIEGLEGAAVRDAKSGEPVPWKSGFEHFQPVEPPA